MVNNTDKIKIPHIFIFGMVSALVIIISVIIFGGSTKEKAVPVVQTLSQSNAIWYDDNIWDENYDESNITIISETIKPVSFPIDINTAIFDELIQIKGIGEATANSIIAYRNKNGMFTSVDELDNVSGIGLASIDKWREYLYVDESVLTGVKTDIGIETEIIPNELININTATIEELTLLDGIGNTTAEKIYEYAVETGFKTVDDLINVDGIGEKKLEKLRPYICV